MTVVAYVFVAVVALLAAMIILGPVPYVVRHLFNLWRNHAAARWPKVAGTITGSEIVHRWLWLQGPRCRVVVHYDYEISGRAYSGSQLTFYRRWTLQPQAFRENEHFRARIGKPVDVYYHARDPACSVIAPGLEGDRINEILLALLLLVLPLLAIAVYVAR
jgi:hypothetical protein